MATYLTRNQTNGNQDKWTFSSWVKRSSISSNQCIFATSNGSTTSFDAKFDSSDRMDVYNYLGGGFGARLITNRVFRDVNAWYHIVIVYDSGNSTEAHRLRIYVNGTEETSFSTTNYPSSDENSDLNVSGSTLDIGRQQNGSQFFLGYLAQSILADGQAYAPTVFGSTNADGVWVPITSPSVTYGTNGFKLDFTGTGASADSSGFGADSSGNNNHFASNSLGTNPNTKDGPANNFSTMNPVAGTGVSMSKGALVFSGNYNSVSSFGVYDGKWYCEMKITNTNTYNPMIGIAQGYTDIAQRNINNYPGQVTDSYGINREGNLYVNGSNSGSQGFTLAQNDIVGVALDLASGTKNIKFYKNGSQVVSQNLSETLNDPYVFVTYASTSQAGTGEWNFGNPPFTIASSNSDANGYGSFEYAVPSGYYALCSKNLGQYG